MELRWLYWLGDAEPCDGCGLERDVSAYARGDGRLYVGGAGLALCCECARRAGYGGSSVR